MHLILSYEFHSIQSYCMTAVRTLHSAVILSWPAAMGVCAGDAAISRLLGIFITSRHQKMLATDTYIQQTWRTIVIYMLNLYFNSTYLLRVFWEDHSCCISLVMHLFMLSICQQLIIFTWRNCISGIHFWHASPKYLSHNMCGCHAHLPIRLQVNEIHPYP